MRESPRLPIPKTIPRNSNQLSLQDSVKYGIGCLSTAIKFKLHKFGLIRSRLFRFGDDSTRM